MPIQVRKIADIVGSQVAPVGRRPGDTAAALTDLEPVHDPIPDSAWQLELIIGEAAGARRITIDLPSLLSKSHDLEAPVFLGHAATGQTVVYFRNRLFVPDRGPLNESERAEITLRVKKAT